MRRQTSSAALVPSVRAQWMSRTRPSSERSSRTDPSLSAPASSRSRASTRRARSTMRASRVVRTASVVPSAVRRNTGATASWIVWVRSWRPDSLIRESVAAGRADGQRRRGAVYISPHAMKLTLGISPCPNDTFIFDALAYPAAARKSFMVFSAVEGAVLSGAVDAGVIIHEGRFTYAAKGLAKVQDLGEFWEKTTGAPIPLGGIVARRTLAPAVRREVDRLVRASVEHALARRPAVSGWVRRHAQEMDETVMRRHIDLYVNEFSIDLGDAGRAAVRTLLDVHARLDPSAPAPGDGVFG